MYCTCICFFIVIKNLVTKEYFQLVYYSYKDWVFFFFQGCIAGLTFTTFIMVASCRGYVAFQVPQMRLPQSDIPITDVQASWISTWLFVNDITSLRIFFICLFVCFFFKQWNIYIHTSVECMKNLIHFNDVSSMGMFGYNEESLKIILNPPLLTKNIKF